MLWDAPRRRCRPAWSTTRRWCHDEGGTGRIASDPSRQVGSPRPAPGVRDLHLGLDRPPQGRRGRATAVWRVWSPPRSSASRSNPTAGCSSSPRPASTPRCRRSAPPCWAAPPWCVPPRCDRSARRAVTDPSPAVTHARCPRPSSPPCRTASVHGRRRWWWRVRRARRSWWREVARARAAMINAYGPTETDGVRDHGDPLSAGLDGGRRPIGRPIANTRVYVLDDGCSRCRRAWRGSCTSAGAGSARGYLDGPGLTAERFVADPFGPVAPERGCTAPATWCAGGPTGAGVPRPRRRPGQAARLPHRTRRGRGRHWPSTPPSPRPPSRAVARDDRLVGYVVRAPGTRPGTAGWRRTHVGEWQDIYDALPIAPGRRPSARTSSAGTAATTRARSPSSRCGSGGTPPWPGSGPAPAPGAGGRRRHRSAALAGRTALRDLLGDRLLRHRDRRPAAQVERQSGRARGAGRPGRRTTPTGCRPGSSTPRGQLGGSVLPVRRLPRGRDREADAAARPRRRALRRRRPQPAAAAAGTPPVHRTGDGADLAAVRRAVEQAVRVEKELLVDPDFFTVLREHGPDIGAVAVEVKRGRHHNELTRYRYDVTLHSRRRPGGPGPDGAGVGTAGRRTGRAARTPRPAARRGAADHRGAEPPGVREAALPGRCRTATGRRRRTAGAAARPGGRETARPGGLPRPGRSSTAGSASPGRPPRPTPWTSSSPTRGLTTAPGRAVPVAGTAPGLSALTNAPSAAAAPASARRTPVTAAGRACRSTWCRRRSWRWTRCR